MIDNDTIELELTQILRQSGIVISFVLYRGNKIIELSLNHKYESKMIPFTIDTSNWIQLSKNFEKRLKEKGIDHEHVLMLSDTFDNNWKKISELLHKNSDSDSESGSDKDKNAAQKHWPLPKNNALNYF